MNIFQEFEDIVGKVDTEQINGALREFFELAADIRCKLGKKAYLLDKYISYLLAAANKKLCYDAASDGFEAHTALFRACRDAVEGGGDGAGQPLHEAARAYLTAHPMELQERSTKNNILIAALTGEIVKSATAEFAREQQYNLMAVIDMIHLKQLYEQISDILGGELPMEKLNLLFRQRFLAVPWMAVFVQGLTNQLLYALNAQDIETKKQIFQLVLEQGL